MDCTVGPHLSQIDHLPALGVTPEEAGVEFTHRTEYECPNCGMLHQVLERPDGSYHLITIHTER
jgi:hypothetical protein